MKYTIKKRSSITIYLSLVLCLIISIILAITEMSRMKLNRLYLQVAVNSSIDSMLSLYNKKLWQYYRIFGVDYKDDDLLKKEYLSYLKPYVYDENTNQYISNWFNAKLNEDETILKHSGILDDCNFEQEVIDYMLMIIPGKVINLFNHNVEVENATEIQNVYEEILNQKAEYEKNRIYQDVDTRYFDFDDKISEIESLSKTINDNVARLNNHIKSSRGLTAGKNINTAKRALNTLNIMNSYANTVDTNIKKFVKLMEELRVKVCDSESRFNVDVEQGLYNFNDTTIEFINNEFNHFKEYSAEDNEINIKAEQLSLELDEKLDDYKIYETDFSLYIRKINDYQSDKRDIIKEHYSGYLADIREINEKIQATYEEIYETTLALREDLSDLVFTEPHLMESEAPKKDLIRKLKDFLGQSEDFILKLTMPEEKFQELDNNEIEYKEYDVKSSTNILTKILMGEYFFDLYNYYDKEFLKEETPSGSKKYEVERLIAGKKSNKANIKSVIYRILAIREGLNLMFLYSHPNVADSARHFIQLTFGALSPIVAEVVFLLVLTVWAFAQSIVDIKNLLNDKRVMFFHNDDSFTFNLDGLFDLISGTLINQDMEYEAKSGEVAFNYKDYLRLLLLIGNDSEINSRACSIIQYNINNEASYFDLEKCIYSFNVENEFLANNFFTNMLFVGNNDKLLKEYKMKVNGYGAYAN